MTGIEPVTSSLPRKRSTPELHRPTLTPLVRSKKKWGEQDSNLRRRSQQIYSLPSLTA